MTAPGATTAAKSLFQLSMLAVAILAIVLVVATAIYLIRVVCCSLCGRKTYSPNSKLLVTLPMLTAIVVGLVLSMLPRIVDRGMNKVVPDIAALAAVTMESRQVQLFPPPAVRV